MARAPGSPVSSQANRCQSAWLRNETLPRGPMTSIWLPAWADRIQSPERADQLPLACGMASAPPQPRGLPSGPGPIRDRGTRCFQSMDR